MTVNIGHLFRKRTVRKLDGSIIDLTDEADGGVIISKGRIVNQEKINELAKIEEDRRSAAQAVTVHVESSSPNRDIPPSKMDALEKRMNDQDAKLDAILSALKK